MFLEKFTGERIERFEFGSDYSLNPIEISVNKSQKSSAFRISFSNDENNEKLRLLAILSPIFIASFDNGAYELEYLKDSIANSSYEFGLYPHFLKISKSPNILKMIGRKMIFTYLRVALFIFPLMTLMKNIYQALPALLMNLL